MTSATQTLGSVDELIAADHNAFTYPERAQVLPLLGTDSSTRNYVLQGSAPTVRQASRSWVAVPTADMETLNGYATDKTEVTLTEEDGTTRPVILMGFNAHQRFVGVWDVNCTLIETADPTPPGS